VKNYFEMAREALLEMIRQVGPLMVDAQGVAVKGVLVRHVEAPLPEIEKREIREFLQELPEGVRVSVQDTFVMLE
jgi:putative pyruvate formate lyase activating enzyme